MQCLKNFTNNKQTDSLLVHGNGQNQNTCKPKPICIKAYKDYSYHKENQPNLWFSTLALTYEFMQRSKQKTLTNITHLYQELI